MTRSRQRAARRARTKRRRPGRRLRTAQVARLWDVWFTLRMAVHVLCILLLVVPVSFLGFSLADRYGYTGDRPSASERGIAQIRGCDRDALTFNLLYRCKADIEWTVVPRDPYLVSKGVSSVTPLARRVEVAARCSQSHRTGRVRCSVYPMGFPYHRGGWAFQVLSILVPLVGGWFLGYWLSHKLPQGGRRRPVLPVRGKVRKRVRAREQDQLHQEQHQE